MTLTFNSVCCALSMGLYGKGELNVKKRYNSEILSGIAPLTYGTILIFLLYTPWAFAELLIHEVQPHPIDAPERLVIWGTDFNNPEVLFGTYPSALALSTDQSLCDEVLNPPAPPLDPGPPFDCIVVDLPDGADYPMFEGGEPKVPAGDYLLRLWQGDVQPFSCEIKPGSLSFIYNPADCSGINSQSESFCSGDMTGSSDPVEFIALGNNAQWNVAPGTTVADGGHSGLHIGAR